MRLTTFAFLYDADAALVAQCRALLPDVDFIGLDDGRLPSGLARAEAAAISWDGPPVDSILAAAPRLAWLHQQGAGIDRLATPAMVESGVLVTNGSGNHAPNIAEHVLALMLAFARQLPALWRAQAEGRWQPPDRKRVFELSGQTVAIVGTGAIGTALATRAAALGLRVLGVRRSGDAPPPPGFAAVFTTADAGEAFAQADHVVAAMPLTAATRSFFGVARLAAMKRGACFYNVGRGGLVDHDALLAALRSGQLAGAGLDVTDPEPLPSDSPLWAEPNVIVTAHSAGMTPHSHARHAELLLDNLGRYARGEALRNVVDPALGY